jgi:hypothetical protein
MLYAQSPAIRTAMTTPQPRLFESGLVALRKKDRAGAAPATAGESHDHAAA